jgi:hypothetical protein
VQTTDDALMRLQRYIEGRLRLNAENVLDIFEKRVKQIARDAVKSHRKKPKELEGPIIAISQPGINRSTTHVNINIVPSMRVRKRHPLKAI